MIFLGSWQTNFNIYMKGQRAYGSQNTLEEEDKEGRGTFSTWQQGSLQYYSS